MNKKFRLIVSDTLEDTMNVNACAQDIAQAIGPLAMATAIRAEIDAYEDYWRNERRKAHAKAKRLTFRLFHEWDDFSPVDRSFLYLEIESCYRDIATCDFNETYWEEREDAQDASDARSIGIIERAAAKIIRYMQKAASALEPLLTALRKQPSMRKVG